MPLPPDHPFQAAAHWIEQALGGRVEDVQGQARWRTAWYFTLVKDGQRLPLYFRGHRPGLGQSSKRLLMELQVMQVLESHGIPVPHCYGLCPAETGLEGIVMERRPGEANLARLDDAAARRTILNEYIDALAAMHRIPVSAFDGIALTRPDSSDARALADLPYWEAIYRKQKTRPEPLLEYVLQWLKDHKPAGRDRSVFLQVDSGQFIYDDGHLSALLDFELAMLGDPMADLAGLRTRHLSEPLGDLAQAYQRYEQQTGDAIDHYALDYHTVRFALMTPLPIAALCANPPPGVNLPQYLGWYYLYSRVAIQGIARVAGIALSEPVPAVPEATAFTPAQHALHQQLNALHAAAEPGQAYALDIARRTAQYLERADSLGHTLEAENRRELSALLGQPVTDWHSGQQQLEHALLHGAALDTAALLNYFYRSCQRQLQVLGPALRELEHATLEWGT